MKWVKVAIGAVIAISVIPIIAIAVNNSNTTELKTIEFRIFISRNWFKKRGLRS